jgi:hypothetical protein
VTERPYEPVGDNPAGLITDVLAGLSRLVQGEIALAKAEVARSLQDIVRAMLRLLIAAILGITALNVLAGAAIAALVGAGLSPLWASIAVGGVLLLVAGGLVQAGLSLLKATNLAPQRSMNSLRRDVETLKSMVTPNGPTNLRT